jgi:hypothetical protein
MPIFNEIRVKRGYSRMPHHEFVVFLLYVYQCMLNNPHFPRSPVDLALFKAKIDEYSAAITATSTRATLAYSQRDSLRDDLNKMLLLIGAYVEHESNNDPAIFDTSGLEALPMAHAPQTALEKPKIPKVDHGPNSGVLQVWLPPSYRKIRRCKLEYVPVDVDGVPTGEWTQIVVCNFQKPVTISNLQPGTRYAFRLNTFGTLGESDWSDLVIKICT